MNSPLGVNPEEYEEIRLNVSKYDLLVTYTDGLTDRTDELGRMFNVPDTIKGLKAKDVNSICDGVLEAARRYSPLSEPPDDITLMLIRLEE